MTDIRDTNAEIDKLVSQDVPTSPKRRGRPPKSQSAPAVQSECCRSEEQLAVMREEHLRDNFAMEAFKVIMQDLASNGKLYLQSEAAGTQAYKLADAAIRGRKTKHRTTLASQGTTWTDTPGTPEAPPAPLSDEQKSLILRPLDEIP